MRQVWMLAATQALCASGSTLVILLGGILGARLAPDAALATLPVSLTVLGLALSIFPAGALMQRIGRRRTFVVTAFVAAGGCVAAGFAVAADAFWSFCASVFLLGANNAMVMQYRFAAIEYVEPAQASRAIAAVMTGSLAAAWLGPELGVRAGDLVAGAQYAGSFHAAAGLYLLAAWLLWRLPESAPAGAADARNLRPLAAIAAQPVFVVAVLGALASYAVMSFLMTATPISMHVMDLHSELDTKRVIQGHLLAMYAPALVSGWIVARLGIRATMTAGALLMAGCVAIGGGGGHGVAHYGWAMVLLGVGWNLLFVAATTLLTFSYRVHERLRVQTLNEFIVFGSQAAASLLAGFALATLGWERMNLATLPLLVAVIAGVALLPRRVPSAA